MKLKNKSSFYALPKRTSVPLGEPLRGLRFFNLKDMETWKNVPGYEGLYIASNLGNIKSLKSGKVLSPNISTRGYYYLGLYKDKKRIYYTVHRLILYTFNYIDEKSTINHKNLNKLDNRIENLEYLSIKENLNHYYDNKKKYYYKNNGKYYPSLMRAYNDLGIYFNCYSYNKFYNLFQNNKIINFVQL